MSTTRATVYHDATSDPANPGWVLRHTDYDASGEPILGRIAMDEQLSAETEDEARVQARKFFGRRSDSVIWEDDRMGMVIAEPSADYGADISTLSRMLEEGRL